MILRDYLYLDIDRVQDYLSSLGPGIADEFRETVKEGSGREANAALRASVLSVGGAGRSNEESVYEATYRIRTQNWFHRVYEELEHNGAIKGYDEDSVVDVRQVRRGEVVEITRDFSPSPLNQMIDQIFKLIDTMGKLGLTEQLGDEETQRAISMMTLIFRGDQEEQEVPMVAKGGGQDASVIFTARTAHMLKPEENFYGDLTVFGRVQRKTSADDSVDLFDVLRLPSGLQRAGASDGRIRDAILELFETWPEELGGPLDKEAIKVPGPALIVTPVAVYT